jgi:fructuronate reductase
VVDDPLASRTAELIEASETDEAQVRALLGLSAVFPASLAEEPRFVEAVTAAFLALREHGAVEAARRVTE